MRLLSVQNEGRMINVAILFIAFMQRLSFKPQNVFLFSAVTWGTLTVFITPPFQVPDEPNHFFRAYQIADGTFFPETSNNRVGGFIPVSLIHTRNMFGDIAFHPGKKIKSETIFRSLEIPLNPKETAFAFFPNTGLYTPVPYIPQSLVIIIGKLFNAPPLVLLYSGRLFNLFCWIILVTFAIKTTPVFKWFFVVLALMPMSVFQASSVSADVLTNGIVFLFITFMFKLAFDDHKSFKKYDLCFLIFLLVILILSKYAYFFLFLLWFLIPVKKAITNKKYILATFLLLFITGLTLSISGYFVKHIHGSIDSAVNYYGNGGGVPVANPYLQIQYIITHVGSYFNIILNAFWFNKFFVSTFIGNLGWLDTPLPVLYVLVAVTILILAALGDSNENITISMKKKSVFLLSLCSVIFVLCTMLYMSWTPIGASIIDGLQGRYFIPIAPLFFLLFYNRKLNLSEKTKCIGSIVFIVISFLVMNYSLISRYYLSASF